MGMMQDFAQVRAERRGGIVALKNEVTALCREADGMVKEFGATHAAMGRRLRADLNRANYALREAEGNRKQIADQDGAQRRSDIEAMQSDVRASLKESAKSMSSRVSGSWPRTT